LLIFAAMTQPRAWTFVAALTGLLSATPALAAPPVGGPPASAAATPAAGDWGPALDLSAVKEKLVVFTDGKKHFIVTIPPEHRLPHFYYGDGKTFWAQRGSGWQSAGGQSRVNRFWEPRIANDGRMSDDGLKGSVEFDEGKYAVVCGSRKTELTRLPDAERTAMLGSARFFGPRWTHKAYGLARDTAGKYFYVDKVREPEESRSFRLFVGVKGNLKLQKMTNVVSDSEGDVFATPSGSLRLVLDKHETSWIEGKKTTPLVSLPIPENIVLIYSDLGVYSGERLGTPCDDL
jgi:hypothetical protein